MELGIPAGFRRQNPDEVRPIVGAPPRVEPDAAPHTAGWSGAATAAHSILQIAAPMMLRLDVSGHGRIVIDFARRQYVWDTPLESFPPDPERVLVGTQALDPAAAPPFPLPARELDPLLWLIGLNSFGDGSASWLRPGNRYRLVRWPNLTELPLSMDHVRITALLSNVHATPEELANAAEVPVADARRTVNALSLMGVLRGVEPELAPGPPTGRHAVETRGTGLFGRLRRRLGL